MSPSTKHDTVPLLPSSIWLAHPNNPHTNYHLWKATSAEQNVNWMTIHKQHLRRADVQNPSWFQNEELVIIVVYVS